MRTNASLIKEIEKNEGVVLSFSFIDCYGLYCDIKKGDTKIENINVYDSGVVVSQKDRAYYLRQFLEDVVWQFIDELRQQVEA